MFFCLFCFKKQLLSQIGSTLEELEQRFFNISNFQDGITPIGSIPVELSINPLSTLEVLELRKRCLDMICVK